MKKDKSLSILRQFTQKQLQDFLHFLRSPYFNKRSEIVHYVEYLAGFHPNYPEVCVKLEQIPTDILPSKKQTKKELSYLKSRTFGLLKQFISYEQIQNKPLLLDVYATLGMSAYAPSVALNTLNQVRKRWQEMEQTDTHDLLFHYLATDILHVQAQQDPKKLKVLLQESVDLLDEYYLVNKLIYGIEIQHRQKLGQQTTAFRNPFMDDIEQFLLQQEELPPRTSLYFQIYLCGKYPEVDEHFDRLVRLLYQNQHKVEASECRMIYLTTINICIRRIRINKEYFAPICLELYEEGIRTKIIFEHGLLSEWTYRNAIKIGLQLERIEWTEKFIYEHNKHIAAAFQNNALYLNLAELYFTKKEFDAVLDQLAKVNTNHFIYYMSTKTVSIKTFYEVGNIDSCMSAVGSFTVYLSRLRRVSPAIRKNYQHFCQVLYQILMSNTSKKIDKVKTKLLTLNPLTERAWLHEVFQREHPRA
ncbi:MAG: hypothetical protein AAFN81_03810 [Bacteroidota bacterium]